jgi:hypothetical protein
MTRASFACNFSLGEGHTSAYLEFRDFVADRFGHVNVPCCFNQFAWNLKVAKAHKSCRDLHSAQWIVQFLRITFYKRRFIETQKTGGNARCTFVPCNFCIPKGCSYNGWHSHFLARHLQRWYCYVD